MIRTLRARIILSHILPLLIILLLIGISFDFLLETKILLPLFATELENEAELLAELSKNEHDLWKSTASAQHFLDRIESNLDSYLSILDSNGILLASSDPGFNNSIGSLPEGADQFLNEIDNELITNIEYSRKLETIVVDVFVPVQDSDDQTLGIFRLTYHLEDIYQEFLTLRILISTIIGIGIILGVVIALVLSVNLGNALKQVGTAVQKITTDKKYHTIEDNTPEEIRTIYDGVNEVVSQLNELEDKRRMLLSNLVHELGRPLGGLVLGIQALQSGADNGLTGQQQTEMLSAIEKEINVLRRLLDDLEGMHEQLLGKVTIIPTPTAFSPWIHSVLQLHKETASSKGLSWEENIPDNLPVINFDPERIGQAIGNILDNAIKFSPNGGQISISTNIINNELLLYIEDTGPGILLEDQEKIFTPFWRGTAQNRFPRGMGLGLSIALDILLEHQGKIEFKSIPEQGTIFTIILPITSR